MSLVWLGKSRGGRMSLVWLGNTTPSSLPSAQHACCLLSPPQALVMEPSTILGAVAGGYINRLLPPWLTNVALAVLLSFLTSR